MIKILFICHGNICRSPMAEFVMKDLVKKAGLSDQFEIASAATSREEIGNPVHRGTKNKLKQYGISTDGKCAIQMTSEDYRAYDYIIAMERYNLRNMERFVHGDPAHKVHLLLDFTDRGEILRIRGTQEILMRLMMMCWKAVGDYCSISGSMYCNS